MASRTSSKNKTPKDMLTQAVEILRSRALAEAFSADSMESRPTDQQLEILKGIQQYLFRYVVAGNQSGKTTLAIRELTWLLNKNHPYWVDPPQWGDGPRTYIVAGKDRTQMENMWQTRISPFLNKDEWKENRSGSALQSVMHRERGDQIIFISHNNSSEQDIAHMQYYSAHWVWVDEMPKSIRVLEELQRRTDAMRAPFLCTFTMKVRNDAIRKLVDASDTMRGMNGEVIGRKFMLGKLDNPIYADRVEEEMAKLNGLSEESRNAILYGTWLESDTGVYQWSPETMSGRPEGYNPSWRHVLSVDPATESKLGMTVWAESPVDGVWWCVRAKYVSGIYVPSLIVEAVEREVAGLNVVKRIYDSAEPWYAHQALHSHGTLYSPVLDKSGNKQLFISRFQQALGGELRIAEWCYDLIAEIQSCERADGNAEKIINASSYHLLDSAHYFTVSRPPREKHLVYSSRAEYLIQMDNHRIEKEHKTKQIALDKALKKRYAVAKRRRWV
jgi:hypothetical protein